MSYVVQGILTARAPKYSVIVELDRKVRDMTLPEYAIDPPPEKGNLDVTMQHFMPHNYRHLSKGSLTLSLLQLKALNNTALLYIHRAFFAQGILDQPNDPLCSQYAPSILSGYGSAVEILKNLQHAFSLFPAQIARFWVLWTHAFSATVRHFHVISIQVLTTNGIGYVGVDTRPCT